MIESAIISLNGTDRASKIETYATLSNLFRAFDNIPDRSVLFPRLPELFECILADVMRTSEEDTSTPDFPLNTKALKIAGFLLFDTDISAAIPAKFARSLIEHSLSRMEATKVTKATSTQYLWLWQTQRLPKTIMTAEVAERILLATVKADFPSLIINQERMSVFVRLLDQSRECMVKNVDAWLPGVINYLLDDNKVIRTAALRIALEAGKQLCKLPAVGRSVQNHLKSEVNGEPYIKVTSDRFRHIMSEAEGGIYVAHAWGAICTLSSSQNPEKSKTLMDWMHVLQIVFNSASTENKIMAQSAWVRMIHYFANNGDIVYRNKNLTYLTKPMARMLSQDIKVYDTVRMAAVNTVCSLLYALCKPSISSTQIDLVWSDVIDPVLNSMLESHQRESLQQRAVDILTALFQNKSLSPWTLDRLLENRVGSEKEIVNSDVRWIRANASKIGPTVTLALRSTASTESKLHLWSALQTAFRNASSKEIQISAETMDATAMICTTLRTLWKAPLPLVGSPSNKTREDISQRTAFVSDLILCTFEHFGTSSFTEKTLSFSDDCEVMPAQTPSQRSVLATDFGTGLKFIFGLFQSPAGDVVVGSDYADLLERITARAISTQKSLRKCMSLLAQCLSCITEQGTKLSSQSWAVLARIAGSRIQAEESKSIHNSPSSSASTETDDLWTISRDILEVGLRIHLSSIPEDWWRLFSTLVGAIRSRFGAVALQKIIIEPLSRALLTADCTELEYVQLLAEAMLFDPNAASATRDNRIENEPRNLESSSLLQLLKKCLCTLEPAWRKYKLSEDIFDFLKVVSGLLDMTTPAQACSVLAALSDGVTCWDTRVQEGAAPLFNSTLDLVRRSPHEALSVTTCSSFFQSCFESQDESIVAKAIVSWNETFGTRSRLSYPEDLVMSIRTKGFALGVLSLPTWPDQDPEVANGIVHHQDSNETKFTRLPPPKMEDLSSRKLVAQTTTRSSSVTIENKKRKRRDSQMTATTVSVESSPARAESPQAEITASLNGEAVKSVPTSSRKRQKRNSNKLPVRKSARRSSRISTISTINSDDVFEEAPDEQTFTLRKRDLRELSPQIQSDPISESSPSIYSRVRKPSSSQEPPAMDALWRSARFLSPTGNKASAVYQDDDLMVVVEDGNEGEMVLPAAEREDEQASPSRQRIVTVVNSDDLMQMQIQSHDEAEEEEVVGRLLLQQQQQESIDEDLFILQLQQYRTSLKGGRPITPGRREKIGRLMVELTKLSGEVTEAFFSA